MGRSGAYIRFEQKITLFFTVSRIVSAAGIFSLFRGSVALGFWEACGSLVGRMTLRGFGLMSNINGDRVWSRGSHLGIYALLLWGEAGGGGVFFLWMWKWQSWLSQKWKPHQGMTFPSTSGDSFPLLFMKKYWKLKKLHRLSRYCTVGNYLFFFVKMGRKIMKNWKMTIMAVPNM